MVPRKKNVTKNFGIGLRQTFKFESLGKIAHFLTQFFSIACHFPLCCNSKKLILKKINVDCQIIWSTFWFGIRQFKMTFNWKPLPKYYWHQQISHSPIVKKMIGNLASSNIMQLSSNVVMSQVVCLIILVVLF
jgi:hypothetical protein